MFANLTPDPTALLTERQVAEHFGLTIHALRAWRHRGGGPVFAKLGSAVRYRPADVEAWVAANLVTSTSAAGER